MKIINKRINVLRKTISCIFTEKSQLSLFMIGIMLKTSERLKTVYIFKNSDYVSMHCPCEHLLHFPLWMQSWASDKHTSFVPHIHCPFVHVSVAPEQSSLFTHPVVIKTNVGHLYSILLLKITLCSKKVSLMDNSFTFGVDTEVRIRREACRFRTKIEGTRIVTSQIQNSSTWRVGCACHLGMQQRGIRTIDTVAHYIACLCVSWKS